MFFIILTIFTALSISTIAAYFSIVGLAALFAATFWPVVAMGSALEVGKLIATVWLHSNWKKPGVTFSIKTYLFTAIAALMVITALGIYGFLSKGHLEQKAPLGAVELQIERIEQQIARYNNDTTRQQTRLDQLDQSIAAFLKNDKATQGLQARKTQEKERAEIRKIMDGNATEINKLQDELIPLKKSTVEVEAKLGPVKYVAALFGWNDAEQAVRLVIMVIMFAFDPLAVILLIAGTISLDNRKKAKSDKQAKADREAQLTTQLEAVGVEMKQLEEMLTERTQILDKLNEMVGEKNTYIAYLEGVDKDKEQAEKDLADLRTHYTALETVKQNLELELAGKDQTLNGLTKDLAALDHVQAELDELKNRNSVLTMEKIMIEGEKEAAERDNQFYANQNAELKQTNETLVGMFNNLSGDLQQAQEQLAVLKEVITATHETADKDRILEVLDRNPEVLTEIIEEIYRSKNSDEKAPQVPESEVVDNNSTDTTPATTSLLTGGWLDGAPKKK